MTKQSAFSMPILTIIGFSLCVITLVVGFCVTSSGLYFGPTVAVLLYGPPEYLTDPEAFARRMVSISEDVDEESVRIVQTQSLGNPNNLWAVLTTTELEHGVNTRMLSYYTEGETLHINSGFDVIVQTGTHFNATTQRYSNNIGHQFSVHGNIINEEIMQILVSWNGEWEEAAVIRDDTFLLFAERPFWPFSINDLRVTGLNQNGEVISELFFSESLS